MVGIFVVEFARFRITDQLRQFFRIFNALGWELISRCGLLLPVASPAGLYWLFRSLQCLRRKRLFPVRLETLEIWFVGRRRLVRVMAVNASGHGLAIHGVTRISIVLRMIEGGLWLHLTILRIFFRNIFRQNDRLVRLGRTGLRNSFSVCRDGVRWVLTIERNRLPVNDN